MNWKKRKCDSKVRFTSRIKVVALIAALPVFAFSMRVVAQEPGTQEAFTTPGAAVKALITALEANDKTALLAILGPDGKEVISSGDEVSDRRGQTWFLDSYKAQHELVASGQSKLVLTVGPKAWPMPIPLVKSAGKWSFDSAAGKEEILYRRIGANELGAIAVSRGYVEAQKLYASEGHDGQPAGIYASHLLSEPGKHNGLYWETNEGESASPAGPFLAKASAGGYNLQSAQGPTPYHGYFYRILKAQGTAAYGGAKSYEVDGKLTGGFALVAYPAQYRNSGVMTFIVNQQGRVYQKDLGEQTADVARAMTDFNPDKSWTTVPPSTK
jgi:Protein of unknown function (DUF2950)